MSADRARESGSGRGWLLPTLLFVGLFAVYALTIARDHLSYDVVGANWTTWRLATTGTPWIDGVRIPEIEPGASILIVDGANGHTAFGRFPGVVVASLPAYLLWPSAGMTTVPGSLTAALLTAVTVLLVFLTLRRYADARTTWVATLAYGLTTPLWSISANGLWPHTVAMLGIAGMGWAAARERWWLFGLFGGVTLWGRLHVVVVVAVFGLLLGWLRRDRSIVVRIGVVSAVALAGFCAWGRWVYGTWNPAGGYGDTTVLVDRTYGYLFDLGNQAGMWISPDRGILVWTPAVALLLPALVRSWRGLPDWSRALLVSGLAYTVIGNTMNTFAAGEAFYGYRYGLEMLACAVPALALSAARAGAVARLLLGPVLAVQALAFLAGAVNDGLYLPEATVWRDNAFVHAVQDAGTGGWLLVAVFAVAGGVVGRLLQRPAPRTPSEPAPEPAGQSA